jgi:DNA-binding IclR family transcriptional regulator
MNGEKSGSGVKSDETLVSIMGFIRESETAGLSEIASEVGAAKSTVHSHLKSMEQNDFVTKTADGYCLGLRFLDYGLAARRRYHIYEIAQNKVDEIAAETKERVWCTVEEHGEAVYLYGASGAHSIQTREFEGQRRPLHCIAAGKAILAFLPEQRVKEIVDRHGLERRTEHTVTEIDALWSELGEIRERGVAFNREETVEGVHAIAAPVLDSDGSVFGSISIGGPANRLTETRLQNELSEQILGAANEIEINIRQR